MFPQADEVDADFVGQNRLVDDIADHLRVRQRPSIRVDGDISKSVQAECQMLDHDLL